MWGYSDKIPINMPQNLQIPRFFTFWTFQIIWMVTKILETLFEHSHGPKDSKNVSHMQFKRQILNQDAPNPPNPSFWTFWTFLIIWMVTTNPGNTSWILPWSQELKKCIMCGVTITKYPSRCPKYSKFPLFFTFWTFLIIKMVTKNPGITSWALPMSQGFQKGIICRVTMKKIPIKMPQILKITSFGHFGPSWSSWWWSKILESLPEHSHGPNDLKKVSYVGLQWQNAHQYAPNPQNHQFLDILDPPDHPDGDQKSWKQLLSTPMIPRVPKRYHMWGGYSGENKIVLMTPHSDALCPLLIPYENKDFTIYLL